VGNPGLVGLAYEDVSFKSVDDGLTLRGWFLPSPGGDRVIILVHGINCNKLALGAATLDLASSLVGHGYDVLMFDLRGHGESDGNMVSGGYYEKRDLKGAVEYVRHRGLRQVGVLGFSLGAATSLFAAAEDNDIRAVVSDSSYADLFDVIGPKFSQRTRMPRVLLHPILFVIKIMFGVNFEAVNPVDSVAVISPRPILFIQGTEDDAVSVADASRLLRTSHNPRNQLWIVPGAGHTKSYATSPDEYTNKICAFFDAVLQ
jgi:pimeloyl-ACP methyl ester carboxylesterase